MTGWRAEDCSLLCTDSWMHFLLLAHQSLMASAGAGPGTSEHTSTPILNQIQGPHPCLSPHPLTPAPEDPLVLQSPWFHLDFSLQLK